MRIKVILFFIFFCNIAFGQEYPSRQIGKKSYYVYTVEQGNTIYGISKQFSVETTDLAAANPGLESGLRVGQELLIPLQAIDRKAQKSNDIKLDGAYIIHVVQPKETLFSLSKRYGVSVESIQNLNPEIASGFRSGMSIRIAPASNTELSDYQIKPASIGDQKLHRVRDGETLESIAKFYNLSPEQIQSINGLTSPDLKSGYWIKIPERQVVDAAAAKDQSWASKGKKEKYQLVYAIPFNLRENDSLRSVLERGEDLGLLTEISLDFYRGCLLALDSLKKLGFIADAHFFDVAEDVVDARSVLKRIDLVNADVIIGPFHKNNFAAFSDKSQSQKTFIVSPNSFENEIFEDNAYLIRAQASRETLMRYLANYVAIQHQNDNVVMVNSTLSRDAMYRDLFSSSYNLALGSFPNALSDSLQIIRKTQVTEDGLRAVLKRGKVNILVVPSNELAFVSDLITKLSRINTDFNIQLYGLDTWLKYDNIDAEYKDKFKLRLVVPSYVDFSKPEVNAFLNLYREAYDMDPTIFGYGFQGFDLTLFFGKALLEYGLDFSQNFGLIDSQGLFSNYRFGKSTTGKEFENKSAYIVEYENYTIKHIN